MPAAHATKVAEVSASSDEESSDDSDEEVPNVPAARSPLFLFSSAVLINLTSQLANGKPPMATNGRLAQEFASCCEVVSAVVAIDRNTGQSRGFGHVHFTTAEAMEKALKMNENEIDGRAVNIDYGRPVDKTKTRVVRARTFNNTPSEPSATLSVGNLSFNVDEDMVWSFFNECGGNVKSVRLPADRPGN